MKSEEVKALIEAINDLIELKTLFRKIAPTYNLDEENENIFLSLLRSLNQKLQPLFSNYLSNDSTEPLNKNVKAKIIDLMKDGNNALISSNSSKKKLKAIGIDPRQLIVSGGPLFLEDYKIINPNLPEKALPGINKKCENLLNDIKKQDWTRRDLIFIYEKTNATDDLILKGLGEISKIIGKDIRLLQLNSWKDLDL